MEEWNYDAILALAADAIINEYGDADDDVDPDTEGWFQLAMEALAAEEAAEEAEEAAWSWFWQDENTLVLQEPCDCGDRIQHNNGGHYHEQNYCTRLPDGSWHIHVTDSRESFPGDEYYVCQHSFRIRTDDICFVLPHEEFSEQFRRYTGEDLEYAEKWK